MAKNVRKSNKQNKSKKQTTRKQKTKIAPKPKAIHFFLFFGFLVLILPIVHNNNTLDIVMMPRLYFVNVFLLLFSVIFFYSGKHFNKSSSVLRFYLFPILGLWLAVSAISLFFSTNPIEGLYDILKNFNLIAVVIMGSMLLVRTELWEKKLIPMFAVSAIILSIVGFWQYYNRVYMTDAIVIEDDPYLRPIIYLVDGLMAHKNLFSLALFMSIPFTITGILTQRNKWRLLSATAVVLQLILIFLLQTRAVWLGIVVASAVVVVTLILFGKHFHLPRNWRIALFASVLAGVLSISGIFYLNHIGSQNPYVQQFGSIIDPTAPQNIHRINIWKSTVSMIEEKPVTGWGAGNWKLHAGYFFEGRFFDENQLNWQRPHNDFLWVISEKGVFGLLLYLVIFGISFYYLIKVILSQVNRNSKMLALLLIFGLTGYLVASFFDFPYERVFHQIYLAIMLACSVALYHKVRNPVELKISRFTLMIPFLAVHIFGSVYGHKAVQQEIELKKARVFIQRQNWSGVLHHAKQAYNPLKNLDPQANPIKSYEGLAYVNTGDMKKGMAAYLEAYEVNSGSINVLNNFGAALFRNEDYDRARDILEQSISIFPSSDGVSSLSAVYFRLGEYQKAVDIIMLIPEEERTRNMLNNLFSAWFKLEKHEKIYDAINNIPENERVNKINVTSINNLFSVYFQAENYERAIDVINLFPGRDRTAGMINNSWRAYALLKDYDGAFNAIKEIPQNERMEKAERMINSLFAVYANQKDYKSARELILLVPEEDRTERMRNNLRAIEQMGVL